MKKVIAAVFLFYCWGRYVLCGRVKVGDKIGDFKLKMRLVIMNIVSVHRNTRAELFISYMPAKVQQMIMIM